MNSIQLANYKRYGETKYDAIDNSTHSIMQFFSTNMSLREQIIFKQKKLRFVNDYCSFV